MAIDVSPLTPTIGAEISGVKLNQLDADDFAVIDRAIADHLVVFFRDQHITPAEQAAFGAHFGPYEEHPFARPHVDYPNVIVLDQTDPQRDGANSWHSDSSFMPLPAWGSVLRAVQLPASGGDTCWASMYAAWEGLSPRFRDMLDGMTALHDIIKPLQKAVAQGHSIVGVEDIRAAWPAVAHPVARRHPETGRKALFVNNNFTTRICELDEYESRAVLAYLLEHVQRPDFQVRFRWTEGAVAVWDNRFTQHYAVPDYSGQRRVMHRVTLTGDRPI